MRGLRKYLTPFAPDQSGAVSVLYELGGITVICDAGGCTGNICGFDEPRWHTCRSAVFSAGLRDMDAILGRDDKLVAELRDAASKIETNFAAIVGTPVPSVIGTDYMALRRMSEKKLDIPVITIDTTGMELYDAGAEKAYIEIMRRFATERCSSEPGRIGLIGVSPLDMSMMDAADRIKAKIPGAVCYGMGSTFDDVCMASSAEKNIVTAPSGVKAARLLEERFGTPYEVYDPLAEDILRDALASRAPDFDIQGRRILVTDQQVRAGSIRDCLLEMGAAEVCCATWFLQLTALAHPGDVRLREEDDLEELVYGGEFDMLIGDASQWRIVSRYEGVTVDIPQFPVSGRLGGRDSE